MSFTLKMAVLLGLCFLMFLPRSSGVPESTHRTCAREEATCLAMGLDTFAELSPSPVVRSRLEWLQARQSGNNDNEWDDDLPGLNEIDRCIAWRDELTCLGFGNSFLTYPLVESRINTLQLFLARSGYQFDSRGNENTVNNPLGELR